MRSTSVRSWAAVVLPAVAVVVGCYAWTGGERSLAAAKSILAWVGCFLPLVGLAMLATRTTGWPWVGWVGLTFALSAALLLAPSWGLPGRWNWQGKALSLLFGVACVARLGVWREAGFTSPLRPGWWKLFGVLAVGLGGLRWWFTAHPTPPTWEAVAYQATMPGLEEEVWFRGVWYWLLVQAFGPGREWLGLRWNWAAGLLTLLFGLVHVIEVDAGSGEVVAHFRRGPTVLVGLALWAVRERSGSVWPAVALHNLFNASGFLNAGWPR